MTNPLHHRPFDRSTFALAADAWPDLHPARAAMRAMGSGARAVQGAAALCARRDRDLAFWADLPGCSRVRASIVRRYADRIAAAERREAHAARVARIEAALDQAEAALEGSHRHVGARANRPREA